MAKNIRFLTFVTQTFLSSKVEFIRDYFLNSLYDLVNGFVFLIGFISGFLACGKIVHLKLDVGVFLEIK